MPKVKGARDFYGMIRPSLWWAMVTSALADLPPSIIHHRLHPSKPDLMTILHNRKSIRVVFRKKESLRMYDFFWKTKGWLLKMYERVMIICEVFKNLGVSPPSRSNKTSIFKQIRKIFNPMAINVGWDISHP